MVDMISERRSGLYDKILERQGVLCAWFFAFVSRTADKWSV